VFRASLIGLLALSVLALWLLVRPPGLPGTTGVLQVEATPEPTGDASQPTATSTPLPSGEPTGGPSGEQTPPAATPTPASEPEPTPEPTAAGPVEYVVEPGDTLLDIAIAFDVEVDDLMAVNGILEGEFIIAGQVLVIPQ
jgi:LysM repeat protein